MADAPVPTVLAMLICDQVITDIQSQKKSLIGIFHTVNALAFPTNLTLAVYAKLADLDGKYDFKIRMVKLEQTETVLADLDIKGAQFTQQTGPAELAANLVGLQLPSAGRYEFQLYANGAYLSSISIVGNLIKLPGGK